VLIDSRTGHTDVKGICTRQLPDAVVVLFFPNKQNLVGLKGVCEEIRQESRKGLKKNIRLHFVMSNVPDLDDEDRHVHRHLSEFRTALFVPYAPIPIIHRNETLQMLDQPIFVLQRPRSRLATEYRFLVRALQMGNLEGRDGALLFLREVQKDRSKLLDLEFSADIWYGEWITRRRSQGEDMRSHQRQRLMLSTVRDRVDQITVQFWNDAEILFRVGKYLARENQAGMALRCFNRALQLQPDLAEAIFERALCYRRLHDDVTAAEDLLRYLRDHGSQEPDWDHLDFQSRFRIAMEALPFHRAPNEYVGFADNYIAAAQTYKESEHEKKIWSGRKKNETALLELLSISLDESLDKFMKTLELPPLQLPRGTSRDPAWLLETVTERLIQQRRWIDAICWLEHPNIRNLPEEEYHVDGDGQFSLSHIRKLPKAWRDFYWAMAHWGKAGEPHQELCSQALLAFQPLLVEADNNSYEFNFPIFQAYSLLALGVGDTGAAASALDRAHFELGGGGEEDLFAHIRYCVSYWSFQETTLQECHQDCAKMRRMIEGEPIRPAFLGSLPASRASEFISPSGSLPE
jgi:hypothetical protein